MSTHYPPLDFLKIMKDEGALTEYEEIISKYKGSFHASALQNTTALDFCLFAISHNILNPSYEGKFQALNKLLIRQTPLLVQASNFTKKDIEEGRIDLQSEWRDHIIFPLFLGQWEKNKQVYKLDPDFTKALADSDNLTLTKDTIEHLPCESFYIDLSDLKEIYPVLGIYVFVNHTQESAYISSFTLTSSPSGKMFYYSSYMHADYKSDGTIRMDTSILQGKKTNFLTWEDNCENLKIESAIDRVSLSALPIQLITYITSVDADIEESPITKNTYKKPQPALPPKNTFKEVQIWDTGIRFGTAFRRKLKEYAAEQKIRGPLDKKRKPPVPHYRRAHWQRFWVGKHDSEDRHQENKWIPPIFVGGTEAKNVTIHKVK